MPGVETMIGLFINTLPVRLDADPGAPLATYLRALQENQAEMRQDEHAPYAPLAEIQRWSAVPPGEPLFSSLFVFENYPVDDSLGEGAGALQVRDVRLADRADHPLSLAVAPVDAGRRLGLRFTYDGRLAAATVDRLARHLTALLDGFVSRDGGERRLADLPLLTAAERHQLLAEWGAADLPAGLPLADVCCLHQLVEAQAARTPAALAVVQGGREVRYGELDRAAATLALRLRALGVGPEARVPLLAERSPETVVGLLAILKAGGAYVPLDPGAPADRLALLLAKIRSAGSATRLPLLLNGATAAALPEAAREGFVPVLLDDVLTVPPDMPDMPEILPEIPGGARPENLAYVLHTSGSTGTPKGVMVDHRAIVSYLRAAVAAFGLGPGDRGLQTSSLTFDPSLEELFAPLITGGTVVLPEGGMEAAARFLDFVRRLDLTYLSLPTSYWQTLAATLEAEALPAPPRLRLVVIGGERALPERWSAWGRSWDPSWERVRLVNGYGPTEAIVTSTVEVHPGRRAAATDDGEVPIGRPLPGVAVQVRGRDGELAPPGASGELYLGGRLARGYLDQPALTAERFVPDPHGAPGAAPGARLYRTGDLVRFLSDGRLQFLGRADEQVKVRGFRIELGEVEAALAAHPAVLAAAAGTREDAGGTRSLVAWVVPRGGEATKEDDLERFLAGRLPAWMVPSEITLLAALRLTVAGKVDRRALALLAPARRAGEAYTAPRNAMEEELAALWRELLGVERVGVKDDFFALGGHSLLATQLVSRLRRQLGIDLPLAWLFEARTLESLAAELRRLALDREGPAPEIPPSPRRPGGGPYPLSFSQQRLWFIDRLEPGSATFNLADALRFQGRLDPVLLARVLAEIVRRHEVLRTAFPVVDGHPVQQVAPPGPLPLPLADLAGLPAAAREREARRLAEAEAAAPFDLARGPLLRARLLRLGATDHLALFTLHHIVSDGWSLGVLVRELTALYAAGISEQASGEPSPLPELPIQYADFADWQRRHLTGEVLAGHLAYWRERLAGAPDLLPLPTDRPRPAVQSGRGASLRSQLPLDTALAAARPRGETLFMVLLAALAAVLARHSGQEDLLVGTPIANRTHVETEGLIGFFVNTLILRADLGNLAGGEEATFADLLAQVRETTLGAYAHQDLPFERLVEELRPARDLSHAPLSQVTLALQNAPLGTLALPGLTFVPVELPARTTMLDLTLEAAEVAGGLVLDWRYDRDLFDATTICRLAGHFAILLQAAAADPDRTLADLPLLSAAERHQLAGEWSAGDPAPPPLCLHAPAEAQARRDPEALALVQGVERLTYGELDARANRLAHRLAALGVGPEVRVAICIERSVHRLVAALAAQKAGGAYVPLDPTYPAERLGFMLADSGAPVLVISPATREILAAPPGVIRVDVEAESRPGAALGPPTAVTPANTAYVIYTSGSTGQPKGVAVSHGAVTPTALLGARLLGARPGARLLQLASFSFDSSVLDVWGGLGLGATLHLPWPGSLLSGPDLASQLREERISGAVATPSVLATLDAESLPALRFVMAGGERCPAEEMERWSADRRFSNAYGPTEASIFAAVKLLGPRSARGLPPPVLSIIGRPVPGARLHVVDRRGRPVPVGATGELRIGGPGLARGYLGGPEKTAWSFVPDPFSGLPGERLYRTGDLACWLPDGDLTVLGRIDQQVKLRGVRIELGEIAAALAEHPAVAQATVQLRPGPTGPRLVAWVVPRQAGEGAGDAGLAAALRAHLRARLPEAMVPAAFVSLAALPVTPNGKLDPAALPEPGALPGTGHVGPAWIAPRSGLEREIAAVWQEVLQVERVGAEDNFFDLGGHSLLLVEVQARLGTQLGRLGLGREIPLLDLFRHPSPAALARHLQGTEEDERPLLAPRISVPGNSGEREVAVVGMAGRFPGAPDLDRFWENLRAGVESISFFSPEEAAAAGVDAALLADPAYVRAGGVLAGADLFDAGFFDVAPREAQLMDPQQRLFLESATEALENAGYGAGSPAARTVRIGVYAGAGMSEYGIRNLFGHPGIGGGMEVMLGNDKDFVATRASYKLDLRGPALTVQTACSTSLVAVHLACRALLEGECDLALAGGVGIGFPQNAGYLYEEGGVNSPDGHNRAFDARARGTVGGSGLGLVVLKPLAAALADGDTVHAVVRGTAINNDGAGKVGYTAPSESGQAEVIARAQEIAGVAPETIQYVEAHGSATPIGDPIEVAALTRAFRARRGEAAEPESGFCSLGSVKSNIGHTGSAAGIAGLLKTVLALEHREIPPTLHYETPNPRLQLEGSPFRIAAELTPWPARFEEGRPVPRRAGVSSFGLGGTNAHAVLEEAPPSAPSGPARPWHLLALSARTASALEAATDRLVEHLRRNPAMGLEELANMADIAHTLHTGRRGMEHRRILVCRDREDALAALASRDPRRVLQSTVEELAEGAGAGRPVAFVFAGLGEQYPGMARGLYREEPGFREAFDRVAEFFVPYLGVDLKDLLFPAGEEVGGERGALDLRRLVGRAPATPADSPLDRTALLQPAFFALEYALASLLLEWGVKPQAMIGYSLGEYVAACFAGVLSLAAAARLVARRARLVDALPAGAMLAVSLAEAELATLLSGRPENLSIAAVNGDRATVAAGPPEAIAALERRLAEQGIASRRLRTTHAFHSPMLQPAAEPLATAAREIELHPPRLPYLSNVTGTWITASQATDPQYWAEHLLRPVRFAQGIAELWREPGRILLEIGPGPSLSALALQQAQGPDPVALPTLPGAFERRPDRVVLLDALGKLWLAGARVDWPRLYARERRRRLPLPTYPFERQRYWIEPPAGEAVLAPAREIAGLYLPSFRRTPPLPPPAPGELGGRWLLFADSCGVGAVLAERLRAQGAEVAVVAPGDSGRGGITRPTRIVHLWGLGGAADRELGFPSLLALLHALAAGITPEDPDPLADLRALVVGSGLARVTAEDPLYPELAPLTALCRTLPAELPGVVCRVVDAMAPATARQRERLADALLAELLAPPAFSDIADIALRGGERWVRTFEPLPAVAVDGLGAGPLVFLGRPEDGGLALATRLADSAGSAMVHAADEAALRGAVEAGAVAGVVVGEGLGLDLPELPLVTATRERCDAVLGAAAERLSRLAAVLDRHPPGFCLLTAGFTVRIGPGRLLATAVDALVAAFAEQQAEAGLFPWAVLQWDPADPLPPGLLAALTRGTAPRLLAAPEEPLARLARLQNAAAAFAEQPAEAVGAGRPPTGVTLHPRPHLRNPYVPPATDTERALAGMWQALLGLETVGIQDSFFDLGGDSLLGTQVITRVRESFGVDLALPALFELPTPAALAERIDQLRPEGETETEKVARMLETLESLSPEEVERMLAERGVGPEG
ncbi:MAG TPA: amino acid adenylation domain-containing protein [Thermoanaerobaculia bacterium]|nr:amino acid adenylation domain-containing protein [Thermoanaerobaculia bacterium]